MAKSDGSVIIDTRMDTKGFGKGVHSMQQKVGGLTSAVGKLGLAISAAFAVNKLIQFGKEAIDLGSDLQEVQNVVDVTFTTMNEAVNEFARNAAETAGLSETMAKRYTGTFGAMAKAFGFAEEQSFQMSTALTQLAGDVASFYNLTQDEAYTKLKSVFTGETETLKDLGVVMTQSALDAFAMEEGYGKTTKAMSEQEKVALRFAFVTKQLNAASGDFVRTQDLWANQTKILSLNFDSFKANIGQALINIFTPFLKIINQIVSKMAQLSSYFVAFSEMLVGKSMSGGGGSPNEVLEGISDGYDDVAESADKATKAQNKNLSSLEELNVLSSQSGTSKISDSGKTNIKFDKVTTEDVKEETSLLDYIIDKLEEIREKSQFINNIFSTIETGIALVKEVATDLYNLLTKPLTANEEGFLLAANNIAITLSNALTTISNTLKKTVEYMKTVYEKDIRPIVEELTTDFEKLTNKFLEWFNNDMKPVLDEWGNKFDDLFNKHFMQFIVNSINYLATLVKAFSSVWNFIKPIIFYLIDFLLPILSIHIKSIGNRILNFLKTFADVGAGIKAILMGLIDFVVGTFTGDWEKALQGVENIFIGIFNSIASIIVNFCNSVSEIINGFFSTLNSVGNAIGFNNALDFQIPIIPDFQIPYLAKGAVIPPNAPFTAVLGDQRNGRNIEAPEGLLRQIVREELANLNVNVTFEVEGDPNKMFKVTQKKAREYTKRTGTPAFAT